MATPTAVRAQQLAQQRAAYDELVMQAARDAYRTAVEHEAVKEQELLALGTERGDAYDRAHAALMSASHEADQALIRFYVALGLEWPTEA